jgi:hypothetical protein
MSCNSHRVDTSVQANETYLFCQKSLATNKVEALASCKKMIVDGPPLADRGNVLLLQRAVNMLKLSAGTQLPQDDITSLPGLATTLWEKALKISKDKEDFLNLWFEDSVHVGDWLHAQKVCLPSLAAWSREDHASYVQHRVFKRGANCLQGCHDIAEDLPRREEILHVGCTLQLYA